MKVEKGTNTTLDVKTKGENVEASRNKAVRMIQHVLNSWWSGAELESEWSGMPLDRGEFELDWIGWNWIGES